MPGPRRDDPMYFPRPPFHPNMPPIPDRIPNPYLPPPPGEAAPNMGHKEPYNNIKTADDYNNFGKPPSSSNDPNSEPPRHPLENRYPPYPFPRPEHLRPEHLLPPTILQDSQNSSSIDKEIDDIKMKIRDKINNASVQTFGHKRKLDDSEIDSEISSIKMKIRNKIHLAMVTNENEEPGVPTMMSSLPATLSDNNGKQEKPDYGIAGRASQNLNPSDNNSGNAQFTPDNINKDF